MRATSGIIRVTGERRCGMSSENSRLPLLKTFSPKVSVPGFASAMWPTMNGRRIPKPKCLNR